MQNGSLGRRLNLEVRAYNNGVAFRYVVPTSLPVEDFQLDDESTEFSFAQGIGTAASGRGSEVPVVIEQHDVGWVAISEVPSTGWPRMTLMATEPKTLMTRLARLPKDPSLAIHARTPVISSWRVISINSSRDHLLDSGLLSAIEN
jgi:alpha-glucosidase